MKNIITKEEIFDQYHDIELKLQFIDCGMMVFAETDNLGNRISAYVSKTVSDKISFSKFLKVHEAFYPAFINEIKLMIINKNLEIVYQD